MNIALLRKTRDHIADPETPYDHADWCECIAGHALKIAGVSWGVATAHGNIRQNACRVLDLPDSVGEYVFLNSLLGTDKKAQERPFALAMLDRLITFAERAELHRMAGEEPPFNEHTIILSLGRIGQDFRWGRNAAALEPAASAALARASEPAEEEAVAV